MERIKNRTMLGYVMGLLLNAGIGLIIGLIFLIVYAISTPYFFGEIGWSLVVAGIAATTLGAINLYKLYFFYRLSMDVNAVCEGDGLESESFLMAFLLNTVTFGIYSLIWTYKLAQRLRANTPRYGFKMPETGKEILVLHITSFGLISTYELIKYLNRVAQVYNQSGPAAVVGGVQ